MATSGRPAVAASFDELGLIRCCSASPAFWISTYVESRPKTCASRSRSVAASCGRLSSSALHTRPERQPDSATIPFACRSEQLPVDAGLVVVALEVAERGELDEVAVALVRLGQQRQVRVALRLLAPVVRDVDLAAEQRLDAVLAAFPVELDRARERAVVGESDGRHLQLGRAGGERGDAARPVEDRVLGVDVEMDERRRGHRATDHRNGSG